MLIPKLQHAPESHQGFQRAGVSLTVASHPQHPWMDAARTGSVDRMRRGLTVAMTVCTARGVESPRVHATERGLSAEPSESSPCIPSAGKRENRGEDTRCCESATTMADDRRTPGSCRTSHARSPTVACGPFDKMISKSSQSRDHQRDGSLPVSSSCRKTVGRFG